VVVEAAKLHASHWGDDGLDDLPWVSNAKAAPPSMVTGEMVAALWQGFKERYGPRLQPHWIEAGEWLSTRFVEVGARHDGPHCLTHNDYRPDNMMFASARGGHPVTVLDWQSFAYGAGPTDLAYFLAGAVPADVRRAHEPELLGLYHQTLTGLGVTGYGAHDLKRHYGQGGYLLFLTAFFAAMIVTRTERGDAMFLRMLGGAADHMLDHGAMG
jgi:aminoglycoside phosphotransferase (APT) family kinase protein